ncbi:MAG TPA: prolyl oligopeptidase family serine peptidase [Polyangiaceae bacterium]
MRAHDSTSQGTKIGAQPNGEDDRLWLEELSGKEAMQWVRARNAESTAQLAEGKAFAVLNERLRAIFDSEERIPLVSKLGNYYYNFWRDRQHERGIWRRTTLDEYKRNEPEWEVVLDLDALADAEAENWVFKGAACLKPDYRQALISLSRGGADATVVREYDIEARRFVDGGFTLDESKNHIRWVDLDTVFVGTDFGPRSMTSSGYPRIAKQWKRGTPLSHAETVFEGSLDDVSVYADHDDTPGFERNFVHRGLTFYTSETYLRRGADLVKIDKPDDANMSVHREWLLLQLRSDWHVGSARYLAGSLLAADFERYLAGERRLHVLFEPSERTSLAGFSPTLHHILLSVLDNVKSRAYLLTHDQERDGWKREPLPEIPDFGNVNAWAIDRDESDDYFLMVSDFLTPSSLFLGAVGNLQPEKLKQLPEFFRADGLRVEQFETRSPDGTRIPYFQVSPSDLVLDRKNPTLLEGYGGFELPRVPGYTASVGAAWLEKGGVLVVANIRGGGEFGPKWHQAALKANRPRAYEDFIAVAEALISRNVTSPRHLGAMGGSNGGLLVGNMLTRRPDLFGALVCSAPLLDMRRYHKLLAGASWMAEYGDPDAPEEWAFIQKFSPYHNLADNVAYPPVLFTASTRDDRVHPGHARKMVAKLTSMGVNDVLYYENMEGGHSGAANNKQAAFMLALSFRFLWDKLR